VATNIKMLIHCIKCKQEFDANSYDFKNHLQLCNDTDLMPQLKRLILVSAEEVKLPARKTKE